jgi:hypothetical protein
MRRKWHETVVNQGDGERPHRPITFETVNSEPREPIHGAGDMETLRTVREKVEFFRESSA